MCMHGAFVWGHHESARTLYPVTSLASTSLASKLPPYSATELSEVSWLYHGCLLGMRAEWIDAIPVTVHVSDHVKHICSDEPPG